MTLQTIAPAQLEAVTGGTRLPIPRPNVPTPNVANGVREGVGAYNDARGQGHSVGRSAWEGAKAGAAGLFSR